MRCHRAVRALLFIVIVVLATPYSRSQEISNSSRKVVVRVAPQYPALARTKSIGGSVRVEALVAPNGTVKSVDVRGGHPVLAQAAQNAVRQWKWEPAAHDTSELMEIKFTP
jgi:TonB family protein